MFRVLVKLLFLLSTAVLINSKKDVEIKFIKQHLNADMSDSLMVIAFLNWTKEEKVEFAKSLFNMNIRTSVFPPTVKQVHEYVPAQNILYFLDVDNTEINEFLVEVNQRNLFAAPYRWLIVSKNTDALEQQFSNFRLYPDSNVILANKTNEFQLVPYEIYRVNKNSSEMIKMNISQRENDAILEKREIIASRRRNLRGTLLRASIVVVHNDTLNHLTDYRHQHIDTIAKVNYAFVNLLIDFVNGTREFSVVNTWGYKMKNSSMYTGMIGNLQRDEVEIGGTALFLTADRIPVIEYTCLTTPTRAKFVFRQPPLSYVANVFILPFSKSVWICSFSLILLTTLLLYVAVLWEWRQPSLEEKDNALNDSLMDIFMLTVGAVAQQGATNEPRSGAGKMIMIFTFLVLMFLYVSYSANIVALLQSSATNIVTLEDLLESRLKLGAEDIVYNHYYFETATEPIRKAIYEKKIAPPGQPPHFVSLKDGVKRIRQGLFAFHMETGPGYKLMADTYLESEKCGVQEISYLEVVDPHIALKKNSSYKEILNIGISKIQECGLQSREIRRLYMKKPECHTGGANFVSVGLIDAYPAFLVLVAGIILSTILLLLEKLACKFTKK